LISIRHSPSLTWAIFNAPLDGVSTHLILVCEATVVALQRDARDATVVCPGNKQPRIYGVKY